MSSTFGRRADKRKNPPLLGDPLTIPALKELLEETTEELKGAVARLLHDAVLELKQSQRDERAKAMYRSKSSSSHTQKLDSEAISTSSSHLILRSQETPHDALEQESAWHAKHSRFLRPGGKRAKVFGTISTVSQTIHAGIARSGSALMKGGGEISNVLHEATSATASVAASAADSIGSTVATVAGATAKKTHSMVDGFKRSVTNPDIVRSRSAELLSPREDAYESLIQKKDSHYSQQGDKGVLRKQSTHYWPNTPKKPGRLSPNAKLRNEIWESDSEESEEGKTHSELVDFLHSKTFHLGVSFLIALNAGIVGIETDFMARHWQSELPIGFLIVDIVTCICFVVEMVLRFIAFGLNFFTSKTWYMNFFDLTCVIAQVVELAVLPFRMHKFQNMLTFMRTVRLLRLFRITYIFKQTSEVRKIVVSISHAMKPLFWTMVVIVTVIYTVGICLTQIVTTAKVGLFPDRKSMHAEDQDLEDFFGTLPRSIMSLYQAVSDGIHWHELMAPLREHCNSPILNFVFSVYMAFMMFAMMNIITGHIVECAIEVAEEDKKKELIKNMRSVFDQCDENRTGYVTWDSFREHLQHNEETKSFLKDIDIDTYEAISLFSYLDKNHNNMVETDALVEGCTRLRGPAKVSHVMTFMEEWQEHADFVEKSFEILLEEIHAIRIWSEDDEAEHEMVGSDLTEPLPPHSEPTCLDSSRPHRTHSEKSSQAENARILL